MDLLTWIQLGNWKQLDYIFRMFSEPCWSLLTLLTALVTALYMKKDPGYFWAFFTGFWSMFAGAFLSVIPMLPATAIPSLHYPPGSIVWGRASLLLWAAALPLQGVLIIKKRIAAFALLSLLSLNPLVWLINGSYTIYLLHRERRAL